KGDLVAPVFHGFLIGGAFLYDFLRLADSLDGLDGFATDIDIQGAQFVLAFLNMLENFFVLAGCWSRASAMVSGRPRKDMIRI
ncbi:MAG: hypothetical protein V1782_07170, partial [Pseudomonadota bacterium]